MTRMAPILNRPDATRGYEMTGIGASPLVVLGTTEWRFRWKRNKRRNAKSRIISVCRRTSRS
jgi:hypothetical protein